VGPALPGRALRCSTGAWSDYQITRLHGQVKHRGATLPGMGEAIVLMWAAGLVLCFVVYPLVRVYDWWVNRKG
jgi:hypothetical protein